jgi:glycine oxidase
VPRRDGRIIAGTTLEDAGFEKRVTAAGMHKILEAALELIPALAEAAVVETWSGLRPGTPDQLPILGPSNIDGLLIATGHYRNGILLAPVTAKILHDCVLAGETPANAAIFSPLRFQQGNRHATSARD